MSETGVFSAAVMIDDLVAMAMWSGEILQVEWLVWLARRLRRVRFRLRQDAAAERWSVSPLSVVVATRDVTLAATGVDALA